MALPERRRGETWRRVAARLGRGAVGPWPGETRLALTETSAVTTRCRVPDPSRVSDVSYSFRFQGLFILRRQEDDKTLGTLFLRSWQSGLNGAIYLSQVYF